MRLPRGRHERLLVELVRLGQQLSEELLAVDEDAVSASEELAEDLCRPTSAGALVGHLDRGDCVTNLRRERFVLGGVLVLVLGVNAPLHKIERSLVLGPV